jgi:hypothetical protein
VVLDGHGTLDVTLLRRLAKSEKRQDGDDDNDHANDVDDVVHKMTLAG